MLLVSEDQVSQLEQFGWVVFKLRVKLRVELAQSLHINLTF